MVNPQNTICCLNPTCEHPENPNGVRYCSHCGTPLILLKNHYHPIKRLSYLSDYEQTYLALEVDNPDKIYVIRQLTPKQKDGAILTKIRHLWKLESQKMESMAIHEQLPQIIAYFSEKAHLYQVEEYIDGQTLDHVLAQRPWHEAEISEFLGDILPLFDFIHKNGVIHQHIKPSNILRRHTDGKYILINFGLSKALQKLLGIQGTMIGTLGYTPKEQLFKGETYPASDLYSLAVTCIYLLTKVDPRELYISKKGEQWLDYWQENLTNPVSPLLEAILSKLTQENPRDRYQTAQEVIQALTDSIPPSLPKPSAPRLPRRDFLSIFGYAFIGAIWLIFFELWRIHHANSPPKKSNQPLTPIEPLKLPPTLKTFSFETVKLDLQGNISTQETRQAEYFTLDLGEDIPLDLVKIPGGTLMMGSPPTEKQREDDEKLHQVTVNDFYLGKYEVTQEQWQAIMGNNPSTFKKGGKYPVEKVSWYECQEFCQVLSQKTGLRVRLPTEAEWEYACRATPLTLPERETRGEQTPFYFGETLSTQVANYKGTEGYGSGKKGIYRRSTTEVGSFPANGFGLYDIHGNVLEWCQDDYQDYQGQSNDNPLHYKVLRGGAWNGIPWLCRSANRLRSAPHNRYNFIGFRVALNISQV